MTGLPQREGRKWWGASALYGMFLTFSLLTGCASQHRSTGPGGNLSGTVLRIGYQKGGSPDLVRLQGTLEKRLASQGVTVQWLNFPAGPQLMEGIGANSIDIGSAGDTPAIFAQAAGVPMVYIANVPPGPNGGGGFLVPKDSPIHSAHDLKGKRVGYQLGSASTYWLVQVLNKAGLQYTDIHAMNLAPPDAQVAFSSGSLDAWVTWDPYRTIALRQTAARWVPDTTQTVTAGGFYLASRTFAVAHPELVKATLEECFKAGVWAHAHPHEAASILAPHLGLDTDTEEALLRKGTLTGYQGITPTVIALQQKEADTFLQLGFIPKHIDIHDDVLTPAQYAFLTPDSSAIGAETTHKQSELTR